MLSQRVQSIDSSGIRKMFDLCASLKDPINLGIGQPDFPPPASLQKAAHDALDAGNYQYTLNQGIPELRDKISKEYQLDESQDVLITAGASGGLLLAYLTLLDPGDGLLIPDPYFCCYKDLATMISAVPQCYNTYPSFSVRVDELEKALQPNTKAILINSPSNPCGYSCSQEELDEVVEFAKQKGLSIIYDEIYRSFSYDEPPAECLGKYEQIIVVNGFSKSAGIPGWRAGFVIAPREVIPQMIKFQQSTIVCTNSIAQRALLSLKEEDFTPILEDYRKKRACIVEGLKDHYEFDTPGGAFYLFPKAPGSSGQEFVERCLKRNLVLVPGNVFSARDTHFRLSYSASMETLEQGVEILREVAKS